MSFPSPPEDSWPSRSELEDEKPRCLRCHKPLPPCVGCQGHQLCDPEYCSGECRRLDEEEAIAAAIATGGETIGT